MSGHVTYAYRMSCMWGGGGASSLKSQISVFVTRDDANFGVCRILSPTHAN